MPTRSSSPSDDHHQIVVRKLLQPLEKQTLGDDRDLLDRFLPFSGKSHRHDPAILRRPGPCHQPAGFEAIEDTDNRGWMEVHPPGKVRDHDRRGFRQNLDRPELRSRQSGHMFRALRVAVHHLDDPAQVIESTGDGFFPPCCHMPSNIPESFPLHRASNMHIVPIVGITIIWKAGARSTIRPPKGAKEGGEGMNRQGTWRWGFVLILLIVAVMAGCAKKQTVRSDGTAEPLSPDRRIRRKRRSPRKNRLKRQRPPKSPPRERESRSRKR